MTFARYRAWRFKNTILLILSLIAFFYLAETPFVHNVIAAVGDLGYLGAFFVGIFFVSTFTVAPAGAALFHLAQELDPVRTALAAGAGAMLGDLLILRFLKDRVFEELRPVFMQFGGRRFAALFATPYFSWLLPVVGAVIVASPLPDEVGIGMMGLSRISQWQFLALSFALNSLGILFIVTVARAL